MEYSDTVCGMSYDTLKKLRKTLKFISNGDYGTIEVLIRDSIENVKKVRKQAQKMENRLSHYRDAIVDLGFERKRKAKRR